MAEVTYKHIVKPYQITLSIYAVLVNCNLEIMKLSHGTLLVFTERRRSRSRSKERRKDGGRL